MSLWSRFKKWVMPVDPLLESAQPIHNSMVGEPILSFIASLRREGGRRYVVSEIKIQDFIGEKYHWMNRKGYYQLLDKKTGQTYQGYIHDNRLYAVFGLPFRLNNWELTAIYAAVSSYRGAAVHRLANIKSWRQRREYELAMKQEVIDRAAFAKQFQEQ